jgi:hypothetical protein
MNKAPSHKYSETRELVFVRRMVALLGVFFASLIVLVVSLRADDTPEPTAETQAAADAAPTEAAPTEAPICRAGEWCFRACFGTFC